LRLDELQMKKKIIVGVDRMGQLNVDHAPRRSPPPGVEHGPEQPAGKKKEEGRLTGFSRSR
jgi:hypothetical protein